MFEILVVDTWNEYIKENDGMAILFFYSEFNVYLGCLLFKNLKKFNESCSLSKAPRMPSTYLK